MKRLLSILTMVIATTLLTISASAKTPQADIAEKTYNFGTIQNTHDPISHTFTITNTGDAPLVIISASASCGCTRPKYTPEPIPPGAKGEIKVTFIPKGQLGPINKEIKVRTNAKNAKRIILTITGKVTK